MADESKDLLANFINTRLPALPESQESEPREPSEPTEGREVEGRRPEDVVQHEERQPAETQPLEEVGIPAAPKSKKKPEAKTYEIDGKRYTVAELEASGLLEKQIQTARQFEPLQQKYFKTLEEQKGAAPAKPETEKPAEVPQVTNLQIARVYDETAKIIVNDLIASKLLEEDLYESFPRAIQTFIGQTRYAFDEIFALKARAGKAIERLEATISYLNANKEKTEGQIVEADYNKQLDALVAKDAKLYGGLKNPDTREAFTTFLTDEVNATTVQTTGPKAAAFLSKQWVAFNATTIMDAAKQGVKERKDRRFVTGEGSGSRPGAPEESDKPMLDRMIENSGRIRE